jgi:hypothetical protein
MTDFPEECFLEDDGGSEVQAVETADSQGHRQSLHVRVGPVFHGNYQAAEPGVWIELQQEHMNSAPSGPVLLTPDVWRQLNDAVEYRLERKGRKAGMCRRCKINLVILKFCRKCGLQQP